MIRIARTLGGVVAGLVAGLGMTLATLVANARFRGAYLESPGDALGWQLTAGVLAPFVGGWLAHRGGAPARAAGLGALAGAAAGCVAGGVLGSALDPHASGAWAGAVIGAGAGILLGTVVGAGVAFRSG